MDCVQWIQDVSQGSLDHVLESIYHKVDINRTIIIYPQHVLDECMDALMDMDVPYVVLDSIKAFDYFHNSSYRIVLVPFHLIYIYANRIASYMIRDRYLVLLHELSSLQEQCCWDVLKTQKNFYMYVN